MGRRVVVALAVGLGALTLAPVAATWADTGSSGSVQAISQGWWSELSGAATPPGSPLQGLVPNQPEPAPDVPDGVVPVAMRFGQVDRVGAIGITVDAPQGSTVNKLILHLKEATQTGVQQGTGAAVRACPITDFLQPENDGEPANIPNEDCTAHADGVRGDDGTWTFDLTGIANAWMSGTISVKGIRLDPVGSVPGTFQVGFTGYKDATFESDIVPGAGAGGGNDAFATPDSSGAFASTGSLDTSTGESFSTPSSPAPVVASPPTTAATNRTRTAVPAAAHKAAGHTFGDSVLATVLIVVGLAALALAAAWTLGAGGRTGDELVRRQGGVSRALGSRTAPEELHA